MLIKEVFDKSQKEGKVDSVSFFLQLRRNTQIKNLATTLARDPEGVSRIPKETFQ